LLAKRLVGKRQEQCKSWDFHGTDFMLQSTWREVFATNLSVVISGLLAPARFQISPRFAAHCRIVERLPSQSRQGMQVVSAFANVPVGTPHSFKNESDRPAKMLISVAPAGLEQMFMEVGVPLTEGATTALPPTKEEIEKLLTVAPRYGIEIRVPHHD